MTKLRVPGSPHDAMAALVEAAGGVKIVADFEGVGVSTIYKMLDAEQPQAEVSFVRVSRWTSHFKVAAAAEHLALLANGTFLPDHLVDAAASDMEALCELASRSADAIGEYARARSDEVLTPKEARAVRKELRELLVAIHAADARMSRIENGEAAE